MDRTKVKFKKRIFYPFIVIVIVLVVVLTMLLYTNYINRSYVLMYDHISDSLEDTGSSMYYLTSSISNIISQLSFNNRVRNMMYSIGNHTALDLYNAQKELSAFALSSSLVNSIYIYNKTLGGFVTSYSDLGLISTDAFFDQDILQYLRETDVAQKLTPIPREITVPMEAFDQTHNASLLTYIYYETLIDDQIHEAIIINVNQSYLSNLLDGLNENTESVKYIVDYDGNTVISSANTGTAPVLSAADMQQNILPEDSDTGYFIVESAGGSYHVSYQRLDMPKWIIINETPIRSISHSFRGVLVNSVIISIALILLALILTAVLSRWMYKPIEKVVDDFNVLQDEHEKSALEIKQKLLKDLIKDGAGKQPDPGQLSVDLQEAIALLLIQHDAFLEYVMQTEAGERKDNEQKIISAAQEALHGFDRYEAFFITGDILLILLNVTSGQAPETLTGLCRRIQSNITKTMNRSFSATIGPIAQDASELNYYYQETLKAANTRLVQGYGLLYVYNERTDYDELDTEASQAYHKQIVEYLLSGNLDQALAKYHTLCDTLQTASPLTVIFSHTRLAFLVYESVYHLLNDQYAERFKLYRVVSFINNAETLDAIQTYFKAWFQEIHQIQNEITSHNHIDLVNEVKAYISSHFNDPNLSQSGVADFFKLSTAYLGRLFRQITNHSIAAYINEIRLQEAKRLLSDTNLSIQEITQKIGIDNSNYFYSMFKKQFGMTPTLFRKRNG